MDTFVKTSLQLTKTYTNAKIISNATAQISPFSDIVYFDNYKLCGHSLSGVLLFEDENIFELLNIAFIDTLAVKCCLDALKNQKYSYNKKVKEKFLEKLQEKLKDDIYFFVDNDQTLPYTLHFALKDIKARELIRTLAFDEIFLSNGEGCSLGLSKPSRIIQAMGYDEFTSRNAISLNFSDDYDDETIYKIVDRIVRKYKQIRVLE
jgi:selenocysteine lyase/cysteine desulfurase